MSSFLWLPFLGFLIGTFGTLIGAGGGFILVPLLLILYPSDEPSVITSISLAVVFCNALSGSFAYARMKRINYKAGVIFSLAGIPGAILGASTTYYVPRAAFNIGCGAFMVVIALYLLWRPNKDAELSDTESPSEEGSVQELNVNLWLGAVISLVVGYVSSLLGIGGGIIHVPALVHLLDFPVHYATATSHFILAIMALTGTLVHIYNGTFLHSGIHRTLFLSVGVILGAQVGAVYSKRLHGDIIVRCLAIALAVVGVRTLMLALP